MLVVWASSSFYCRIIFVVWIHLYLSIHQLMEVKVVSSLAIMNNAAMSFPVQILRGHIFILLVLTGVDLLNRGSRYV